MATVLSPGGEPGRTVLAVRIGENEDQQDRLPELLALARSLESGEAVSRAVAEVTAIQSAGLARAVSEILTMAEDLRRGRHGTLPSRGCSRPIPRRRRRPRDGQTLA